MTSNDEDSNQVGKGKGRATSDSAATSTANTGLQASPLPSATSRPQLDSDSTNDLHRQTHGPLSPSPPPPPTTMMLTPQSLLPFLQCPQCAPPALLTAPSTLNCGHTVCSSHVAFTLESPQSIISPHPPHPPPTPSNPPFRSGPPILPACPLPTCFPTNASQSLIHPNIPPESSVTYFPPPVHGSAVNPPAPVPSRPQDLRLDVTVCKLISLAQRFQQYQSQPDDRVPLPAPSDSESEDGNEEDTRQMENRASQSVDHISRSSPEADDLFSNSPVKPPRPRQDKQSRRPLKRQRTGSQTSRRSLPSSLPSQTSTFEKELLTELTCEICFMLLYQPVTTPCQHTFCAKCLKRALDHNMQCPLCRTDLPGFSYFQEHPPNKVVLSISFVTILKTFPEVYADRKAAVEAEERDSRLDTPIFVCQLSFPGTPTILHFFEPRYRLMLRRCLETSTPRFGMIMPPRTAGGGTDFGTLLEIRTVQMFPDGRSMVETWGVQRFRILERGTLDGYMVGRIELIDDFPLDVDDAIYASTAAFVTDEQDLPSALTGGLNRGVSATNEELMELCHVFLNKLRNGTAPWVVQRLNHTYGPEPVDDPSNFSFWMALVLPIDEHEKAKLLPIRSPRLRLRLVVHWIEQLNNTWWFSNGCIIS